MEVDGAAVIRGCLAAYAPVHEHALQGPNIITAGAQPALGAQAELFGRLEKVAEAGDEFGGAIEGG